jgi:hypothetical protein
MTYHFKHTEIVKGFRQELPAPGKPDTEDAANGK